MTLRVVQFSTGHVGRHSLRAIIERPELELIGVHAAGSAKVGRDAAELCGLAEPTGVVATDDLAALVGLRADCVVYTSQAETRPDVALEELAAFLTAGTNVVGTSLVWLVYPPHADAWLRDPLERACAEGESTMYINGIDPGFSGDLLPLAALSLVERADHVLVQEIFDYGTYDDAEFTGVSFGFGTPPEDVPTLFLPGVLRSIWGGPVQLLAHELGIRARRDTRTGGAVDGDRADRVHHDACRSGTGCGRPVRRRRRRRRPHRDHHGTCQPSDPGCGARVALPARGTLRRAPGGRIRSTSGSKSTPMSVSAEQTTTRRA